MKNSSRPRSFGSAPVQCELLPMSYFFFQKLFYSIRTFAGRGSTVPISGTMAAAMWALQRKVMPSRLLSNLKASTRNLFSQSGVKREKKTGEYYPHTGLCDVNRRSGAAVMMWLLLREIQPANFLLLGNLMTPQLLANNLQLLTDPFPTAIGVDGRGEKRRPLLLIRGWIFLQKNENTIQCETIW